jgi:hypothetical protein
MTVVPKYTQIYNYWPSVQIMQIYLLQNMLWKENLNKDGQQFHQYQQNERYNIMYVIKFVIDFRQVSGFLQFPPPTKLTATI